MHSLHPKKNRSDYSKINNEERQKHETTFESIVLLGIVGTELPFSLISNQKMPICFDVVAHSHQVMRVRYYEQSSKKVTGPHSTTPVISTTGSFVPLKVCTFPSVASPHTVSSSDFMHLNVTCTDSKLSTIDAESPVSNGIFRDGQPQGDCLCLEADIQKTSWVLTVEDESSKLYHSAIIDSKN